MSKKYLFISHSSEDHKCGASLCKGLENPGLEIRVDSCASGPSHELQAETKQEIEEAYAFIVVISSEAKNTDRVLKETTHALEVEKSGKNGFRVIPVILEGVELATVTTVFGKEPTGMRVRRGTQPTLLPRRGVGTPAKVSEYYLTRRISLNRARL